jgi:hypothetical protein
MSDQPAHYLAVDDVSVPLRVEGGDEPGERIKGPYAVSLFSSVTRHRVLEQGETIGADELAEGFTSDLLVPATEDGERLDA